MSAYCDKCRREIRRFDKVYVCDRCGARFCASCGWPQGRSCPNCGIGRLEEKEYR